mmetsp:Transcript_36447/g.100382  ORF Transcript_36447/g.100382 Transcript_36447/m.100382 type:complete len:446 (-) Transcript_36447:64-1401(-)
MHQDAAGAEAPPATVLVYSHSWLPGQVDGVAVRMMAHVEALVARGSRVILATPDFVLRGEGPQEPPKFKAIPGVEHVTMATQRTPVYRKNMCMELSWKNLWALVALIRRTKPEIVHGTQEASLQVVALACLFCDVPLVVSVHTDVGQIAARDQGFSALGGILGRVHARIAVFCVYWGYRNWAISGLTYFGVSAQSKAILENASVRKVRVADELWGPMVDRKLFCIDQPQDKVEATRKKLTFGIPDAFLMVYVGRVTAEKDIQFLVDALDRSPKRVVLCLVGPGSLANELSELHGPERRLHCTAELVDRENVALAMRAADCCVSASTMETVGFTAMEAISCGTPMLAADAQGFALHLSHNVNARLWKPLDSASFDKELATLMATDRTGSWSREALRASMEMASVDLCTDRALRVYKRTGHANLRLVRILLSLFNFILNWLVAFFMK